MKIEANKTFDDKFVELMDAITNKHVDTIEGNTVVVYRANIARLISELSVEELFSRPYDESPLNSARVFKDTETVNAILSKEGIIPASVAEKDKDSAINDRIQLFEAIQSWDEKLTVDLLDKIGGYKRISDNQAVRRVYKYGIERNFGESIDGLIAKVRGDSVQQDNAEPQLFAGKSNEVKK